MQLMVENSGPLPQAPTVAPPEASTNIPAHKKLNIIHYLDPFISLLVKIRTAIVIRTLVAVHYTARMVTVAQVIFHRLVHQPPFNPNDKAFKDIIGKFGEAFPALQDRVRHLNDRFVQKHEITRDLKELHELSTVVAKNLEKLDYFTQAFGNRVHPLPIQEEIAKIRHLYLNLDQQITLCLATQAEEIMDELHKIVQKFINSGVMLPDEINQQLISTWTYWEEILTPRLSQLTLKKETSEKLDRLSAQVKALREAIPGQPVGLVGPLGLTNYKNSCYMNSVLQALLCIDKIRQQFSRLIPRESENYGKKVLIQEEVIRLMEGKGLMPESDKFTQMELLLFLLKGPSIDRLRKAIFESGLHYEFDMEHLYDPFDAANMMEFFIAHFLPNCRFKCQPRRECPEDFPGIDFRFPVDPLNTLQVELRKQEQYQSLEWLVRCVLQKHWEQEPDPELQFTYNPKAENAVVVDAEKAATGRENPPKKVDKYVQSYQMMEAPPVLVLHFKRLFQDQTGTLTKLDLPVILPEDGIIDLTHFYDAPEGGPKKARYKIKSYIIHNDSGNPAEGHYVANVEVEGKYYHCDDALIRRPYYEISREAFYQRKDAYLMVLERLPDDPNEEVVTPKEVAPVTHNEASSSAP